MAASLQVAAGPLRSLVARILGAVGTPVDIADAEARILVNADLKGYTSHGVFQIPDYIKAAERGGIEVEARPKVVRETPSGALVDVQHGWSHYAAEWCMDLAISKARETGLGAIALADTHHIGRLGEYAEQAAAEGFAGLVSTGGAAGGRGGAPPYGGAEGAFGTNPIAMGVPSADGKHFVSDFATTAISGAKIRVLDIKGEKLPPGCILDKHGNPSVDPADAIGGGTMLLFGGYKGYAVAMLTCLLGGLSGVEADSRTMGGCVLMAIDPSAFGPLDEYAKGVAAFLDGIRSVPPAPGFDEVLVHGDLERRADDRQLHDGIDLPETIWRDLLDTAEKLGVETPEDNPER